MTPLAVIRVSACRSRPHREASMGSANMPLICARAVTIPRTEAATLLAQPRSARRRARRTPGSPAAFSAPAFTTRVRHWRKPG